MKKGFTLIELLVVVLIIGILSAVALPQYQKAVWKSRATQLQTLARSLATAQTAYFAANGTGALSFDDLDLSFPLPVSVNLSDYGIWWLAYTDARATEDLKYACILNNRSDAFTASICVFGEGSPYFGSGFVVPQSGGSGSLGSSENQLYCYGEEFCKKVMGFTKKGNVPAFADDVYVQ